MVSIPRALGARSGPAARWLRIGTGALLTGLVPLAAHAQEAAPAGAPAGGLAPWLGTLQISFGVLLVAFLGLLAWEFLASRGGGATASAASSPYQAPPAKVETPPAAPSEDDPFKSLLQKSSASQALEEPGMATPFRPEGFESAPAAESPYAEAAPAPPAAPARASREEDEDELSPFQRLAQIGSEDQDTFAAPAPAQPARPARIDLGRPGADSGAEPAAAGGGDWAALLSKVQTEGEPPSVAAPPPEPPVAKAPEPPAAEEDDPWRKLLGGASAEAPAAPSGEEDTDPWQALLKKTSSDETPAAPSEPPAAGAPARIRLDVAASSSEAEAAAPAAPSAPEATEESTRPRAISLDLKREPDRPPPPPPQTEDE